MAAEDTLHDILLLTASFTELKLVFSRFLLRALWQNERDGSVLREVLLYTECELEHTH